MAKLTAKLSFFVLFLSASTFADQVGSFKFKGINDNENAVIIDPSYAQDLLNVDITPGGASVKKRSGYGIYKALATAQPLHGGYHFFDSTGNDVQVWGSSTSLYGIVAGAAPTQIISSATLSSIWDCADSQGSAYCVNSNRNAYIKTNGATMTWYSTPLGTTIETTPDRMVVAGVSGTPNTLYISQSNIFTNFTVGINAPDPFTEVIASPGSKLTHIRWGCGKLLWWKDQSFGTMDFDDQFNVSIKTVSDTIGTFDNTSAIDPGGNVWFRGQDGHTWKYDCSFLTKESIEISPNTQVTGNRISNSWTQTTQSDFESGVSSPTSHLNTSLMPGSVISSSSIRTDTTSGNFNDGTLNNVQVVNNSVKLSVNSSTNVVNKSFELGSGRFATNWSYAEVGTDWAWSTAAGFCSDSIPPQEGSRLITAAQVGCSVISRTAKLLEAVTDTLITSMAISGTCPTWTQNTLATSASNYGRKSKVRFTLATSCGNSYVESTPFIVGGDITFYALVDDSGGAARLGLDNVAGGVSSISSGTYTSATFDTGFTYSIVYASANWTVNDSTPAFELQTSTSSAGPWAGISSSTGTHTAVRRYVRYLSTFTIAATGDALTTLDDVYLLSKASGTYLSAVKNAPNINGWSTFSANSNADGGSHAFYLRASTNAFSVSSSTPSWTAQTSGSLISISTGTYFQFRDDFGITLATQTPSLNEFVINWFEGSSTDQAYMIYFDNAIWESVAFGGGQTTNNYIFKYDLINEGWTLYSFGAGGMMIQANALYFGDTSQGNVFQYATGTSDNGSAISAFWKSKEFTAQDPFMQSQLNKIDLFCKKDFGTTLTGTYSTDTSTSTAYSVSLSTSASTLQNRKLLPFGKLGYSFNYKVADNSTSSAWECFGYRMDYTPLPYRPSL